MVKLILSGVDAFLTEAALDTLASAGTLFITAFVVSWLLGRIARLLWDSVTGREQRAAADQRPVILLDGSNIMHWNAGRPNLVPVRDVIRDLDARGYRAGVVFDANVGYKLDGFYQHHGILAKKLGLPEDLVMVVNKGEPADETLLQVAQDFEARVVTNDRFRDWAARFPDVTKPGFLISGRYRGGALQLDL